MNLRTATIGTTGILLAAVFITFSLMLKGSIGGGLFFFLLHAPPFIITLLMARKLKYNIPQIILLVSIILYAAWLTYIFVEALVLHPDPQSGIAVVYCGIVALPVLIVPWTLATVLEANYLDKYTPEPHVVIHIPETKSEPRP